MAIKKTTLHPQGDATTDLYPKTSIDQVEGDFVQDIATSPSITATRAYRVTELSINTDYIFRLIRVDNGVGRDSIILTYTGIVDDTHYGNTCSGESCAIFGEANSCSAKRVICGGKLNNVDNSGSNSIIAGLQNIVMGSHCIVSGGNNEQRGGCGIMCGSENYSVSYGGMTCGIGNSNYSQASFMCGTHNISQNNDGVIVCGSYNIDVADMLIIAGNGVGEENRSNAFTVSKGGILTIGGVSITPDQLRRLLALLGE